MKYKFFLILSEITLIFSAIPNWNYDNISIELSDSELEYTICSTESLVHAETKKRITKNSDSVSFKNYVSVNNEQGATI